MAELPDLTVFAKTLNSLFKGKTLKTLDVVVAKKLNVTASELKGKLEGRKLEEVKREGKTLRFHFGKNEILGLHLMLRGELRQVNTGEDRPKHSILIFHFASGSSFAVTDTLKQATPTLNPPENNVPDALGISEADFHKLLSKRSKKIKEVLMDQKAIRGIGNSYADEILWEARISPLSKANAIPNDVVKKLHAAILEVLEDAIKKIAKENKDELRGELRDFMKIHGAAIKQSPTGHHIQSEKISGRTAYFTNEQKKYN